MEFSVAPPQSNYSCTEIWIELEFEIVGFWTSYDP